MTDTKQFQEGLKKQEIGKEVNKYTKKIILSALDTEKAIVTYLTLIRNAKYEADRNTIKYGAFSDMWDSLFGCIKNSDMRALKIQAFKDVHNILDELTVEEIREYRANNYKIFNGTEVPKELKKLAMEKGLIVRLTENQDKHLSGFDILQKKGKKDTQRLNTVPFGMTENAVKKFLSSVPIRKELVEAENNLIRILEDNTLSEQQKMKHVQRYNTKIATHNFELYMNRFCLKKCKQKQLLNECCLMCQRNGILNLSNKKPIEYTFCAGSGKREKTIKRINARRKGNAKAKKKANK